MRGSPISWRSSFLSIDRTHCSFVCSGILFNNTKLIPDLDVDEELDESLQIELEFMGLTYNCACREIVLNENTRFSDVIY